MATPAPRWFSDNAPSIGRTPLVRLNRVTDGAPCTVLARDRHGFVPDVLHLSLVDESAQVGNALVEGPFTADGLEP